MNAPGTDPKVKKTYVRNCEKKVTSKTRKEVIREVDQKTTGLGGGADSSRITQKNNVLSEPMLCSSATLANYLADVKRTSPPLQSNDDLNVDTGELCSKMTKKLNFHVNNKMYKNLIELNASIEETKIRKDKRPTSSAGSAKRDLEPDIEDFCEDEKQMDLPPKITIVKPKFRPIRSVEDGHLHKLVASLEVL